MSLVKPSPKISIVMPMYRVERYIEKAIRSVLEQDFQDWELLIVNDGSPDDSRNIAVAVAACDYRIKILDKENGGLSDARNYGLDRATGEFVHFYDSDDWIEFDFYSTLLKEIDDYDLVICGYKVDNEKSVTEYTGHVGHLNEVVSSSLYHFVETYLNFAWNKLFKRKFLVENELYYEKGLYRIEDSEFMMRFLSCLPKVKMISFSGYHYMVRNNATLSKFFDKNIFFHMSRSVSIRTNIYKLLSADNDAVIAMQGKYSLSVVKSTLYVIVDDIPLYDISRGRCLINRIINDYEIRKYIAVDKTTKFFDRLIVTTVMNRMWLLLFLLVQLHKLRKWKRYL